ncbi:methylmalonyl-CoA epimerase [Psychromonas ingrahamii 37]|uniref:Methylmalonyl-CoA epimerase n=1 Tax=Psychromonas ingrahamii (strain DSM 17664 / CCUG 51855 / 37) TaxID=357804 RepID=A1SVB5_PSYIN|nr:VOC family protein [Psychromonas ingrahamii]ABM03430.1 methylmalonyl-CoA epimerase [Psychromonas ingrahamii 37]
MNLHHLGIATDDINRTLKYVNNIYNISNVTDIIYDELQEAYLCMVTLNDNNKIELVSGKQVSIYVKKNIQLYHTCWEVDDINKAIDVHLDCGAILVSEPKKAVLFNDRKVAFLYSELGLIELLERNT